MIGSAAQTPGWRSAPPEPPVKSMRAFAAMTVNIAGFECASFPCATGGAASRSGTERMRILTISSVPKPCSPGKAPRLTYWVTGTGRAPSMPCASLWRKTTDCARNSVISSMRPRFRMYMKAWTPASSGPIAPR